MKKAPCRNCEKRTVGCHSSCEEYIEFASARKALNEKRLNQKNNQASMLFYDRVRGKRSET